MRVSHELVVRLGAVFMILGIATQLITAIFFLSPFIAAAGWLVAGMGMGFTYPRISTLVLAHSTPGDQGFNSSAMSIADLAGAASSIAIAGLLFNAFGATAGFGFVAAFALATLIVIIALPVALRVRGVESAEE
jgi:MFS family permease